MANSSTYIMDLPENISMTPFSEQRHVATEQRHVATEQRYNGGSYGAGQLDRGIDMESTTYRQMNPHQNPYIQGQPRMDSMPLPEYGGRNAPLLPQLSPSYDFDHEPLGNIPKFSLPPKDIPLDTSGFRDESAKPNYIPQHKLEEDFVSEQEERIRETKTSTEMRKAVNSKFDLIAELQIPIIVALLFLVFQVEAINRLMARYLKFAGFFGEDGNLNITGMMFKSVVFGSIYWGVVNAAKWVDI